MNILLILLVLVLIALAVLGLAKLIFICLLLDWLGITTNLSSGDMLCLALFILVIYKLSKK